MIKLADGITGNTSNPAWTPVFTRKASGGIGLLYCAGLDGATGTFEMRIDQDDDLVFTIYQTATDGVQVAEPIGNIRSESISEDSAIEVRFTLTNAQAGTNAKAGIV